MPGILDYVAKTAAAARASQFQPKTPDEFFALQLAYKLNEPAAAQHYADLVKQYSLEQTLAALRRTRVRGSHVDPARSFHDELQRLSKRQLDRVPLRRLAAIRIERRAIAVVMFFGDRLDYPPLVRQLPSDNNKAESSAAGFVSSVMQRCAFTTAALELLPQAAQGQRQQLLQIVQTVLSEQAIGIWQVARPDVLAAFSYPPLRSRTQLHDIIKAMWPDINGSFGAPLIRDALALGLYCQTEYLFNL